MSSTRRVVALFRKASYSPNQHRTNDTAILEETLDRLVTQGWSAVRVDEAAIEEQMLRLAQDAGPAAHDERRLVPEADLYLNMCQGARAATALESLETAGALILNRPSSVLACHRHRLVPAMIAANIPFPATEIVDLATTSADMLAGSALLQQAAQSGEPLWIKRGDVHAERNEDVVRVEVAQVAAAVEAFRARGIGRISLQRHVRGPVVKFYAIGNRGFFRYYDSATGPEGARPVVDEARLRDIAFAAADAVGLSIFGGDVVISSPDDPVLIDLNDWPSFAPFRDEAADHIARYALARAEAYPARRVAPHAHSEVDSRSTPQQPKAKSSLASDLL